MMKTPFSPFDVTLESPTGAFHDLIVFHDVVSFATHVINCANHLRFFDSNKKYPFVLRK